jgi:hypothetical protein
LSRNALVFSGTLNADATVVEGRLTTLITAGSLVVSIDNGGATLTKQ